MSNISLIFETIFDTEKWVEILVVLKETDSTKINRPDHNIRMYGTNFWHPTAHVQQNIFGKTLIKFCSPNLYASFGTFYAKIGQLFEA